MDKLKSFFAPGKATDDEILYGSGRSNDNVHSGNTGTLAGEGSHFDNSRDTPSGLGLGSSNVGNAPTTAGPHSTDLANKADPRVDSDMDGSRTVGNTTGDAGYSGRSNMPGTFDSDSNPYSAQELDPRLGGPTTTRGVGSSSSGTGYDAPDQQTGYATQRNTDPTGTHLGRDATAVGTAGLVGEGIHNRRENERGNFGTSNDAPGTYGDNTGMGNTSSNTTTGPHSSSLLNKLDPRVDSSAYRNVNDPSSETGYDGDATGAPGNYGDNTRMGNTSSNTTTGPHSSNLLNKLDPRVDSSASGYSGTTPSGVGSAYYGGPTGTAVSGASGPHTTSTANRLDPNLNTSGRSVEDAHLHDPQSGGGGETADEAHGGRRHHLGRDAAIGAGAVGLTEHEHRKHERERETGMGGTTGIGSNTGSYTDNSAYDNTTGTTGPHKSSLLNKLDPRVDSSSGTTDNTGSGFGSGSGHHYGRDAAIGAGGVGLAEHERQKHEREREYERGTGLGNTTGTGAYGDNSSYDDATGTTGPHKSSLLNKLDPRVDSSSGTMGTTGNTESGSGHHYGRDAAIGAGGVGAVGLAEHEHRQHEREREYERGTGVGNTTGVGSNIGAYGDNSAYDDTTGTSTGPHKSSLLNKLDPRVDSTTGSMSTTGNTGTESSHHYGRDAAIGAGGVGAVGLAEHEHRQHEREREYERGTSVGNTTGVGSNTGAYGDNSAYDGTTGTSTGPHKSSLLNKLDPRVDSTTGSMSTTGNTGTESSHHYGRDAAIGAGGVGAVGLAEHEHRQHEREREYERGTGAGNTTGLGSNTGAYGDNSAYDNTTGTATGPHKSSLLNKLDPRVDSTTGTMDNTGTGTGTGTSHHYGRDAAIGAGGVGAAGLAEHEHRKSERERERERENEGNTGFGNTTGTGAYGDNSTYDNTTGTTTGPHKSSLLNKLDPRVDSSSGNTDTTRSDHHYERDAAVGAGGIGAVGLAEHEHRKHEREREAGVGSTAGIGSNTGAYGDNSAYDSTTSNTAGPHKSSLLNKLDPRVDSKTGTVEDTRTGPNYGRDAGMGTMAVGVAEHEHRTNERAGVGRNTGLGSTTGNYSNDPNYTGTTGTSGHHYDRDAAIGAGGLGVAEHEHRKHERERESDLGSGTGTTAAATSGTGPAPNTAGPHSQDWMNRLDPRVDHNPDTSNTGLSGNRGATHVGRDAAIGAGVVGAAGYEAEKHRASRNEPGTSGAYDEGLPDFHHTGRDASAAGAATGLDERDKARLRAGRGERDNTYEQGPIEPGYGSTTTGRTTASDPYDPSYDPNTTGPMHQQTRDHHLGRDAAVAGVVGGAAYEAEKHHKNDAAEKEQKREVKHEEREARREQKDEKKHHGFLSFLHRDKNKKYTREEEDDFDRQERDHNSRAGRDTAIGGAAVGGAAYEAEKHHGHQHTSSGEPDVMKPLPVAPGNHGIGTGEGTQNALMMDRKRGQGYDTDPTMGAEQPLAAGDEAYQPPGTTVGDKLHGVERNRGVNDGTTGTGYDTTTGTTGTTGTSGYGASTASKPNVLHKDPPPGHPAARAMAGQGNYPQDTTGSSNY